MEARAADDMLMLVDDADVVVGYESKERCHDGAGLLHRAFSVFLFNAHGELLVQQRSAEKRLWPLYWSNSCCSHPRRGEETASAAVRRVREELGVGATLRYVYKFRYQARFEQAGSEHELCSVFLGRADVDPKVDPAEIAAWRFVAPEALSGEIEAAPARFTPWFKMEWQRLATDFEGTLSDE